MTSLGRDLADHWYIYATMPVIAAVIGYLTKLVAVEMMFRPLQFKGIRPFLGCSSRTSGSSSRSAPSSAS